MCYIHLRTHVCSSTNGKSLKTIQTISITQNCQKSTYWVLETRPRKHNMQLGITIHSLQIITADHSLIICSNFELL